MLYTLLGPTIWRLFLSFLLEHVHREGHTFIRAKFFLSLDGPHNLTQVLNLYMEMLFKIDTIWVWFQTVMRFSYVTLAWTCIVTFQIQQAQAKTTFIPLHIKLLNHSSGCQSNAPKQLKVALCSSTHRLHESTHFSNKTCDNGYYIVRLLPCIEERSINLQFKNRTAFVYAKSASQPWRTSIQVQTTQQLLLLDTETVILIARQQDLEENDGRLLAREFSWSAMADVFGVTVDLLSRMIVTVNYGIAAVSVVKYMFLLFSFIG